MAGKHAHALPTDRLSALCNVSGMSKSQLYEVMSQLKAAIEENQQGTREVLVNNPLLTRGLFQAQIMLGMVKPTPAAQQAISQPQPTQAGQAVNVQTTRSLSVQHGLHMQSSSSQTQQQPTQMPVSLSPPSVPPLILHSQLMPSQVQPTHNKNLNAQIPPMSLSKPSQTQNLSLPNHAPPHYSLHSSHMPMATGQPQQPLQTPGLFNQPLQPPLSQQPRPPAMRPFSHQLHPQMAHSLGFHSSNAPQQLLSQSLFNPGFSSQSSFPQAQLPFLNQPPPHQLYQGGSHIGPDYSNVTGASLQADRIGHWAPGLPDVATGTRFPGPSPMVAGHMNQGLISQLPRPPALSPDVEKQLLQQVMSLTQEQINLLPPEQRHQVLQLQEMLR